MLHKCGLLSSGFPTKQSVTLSCWLFGFVGSLLQTSPTTSCCSVFPLFLPLIMLSRNIAFISENVHDQHFEGRQDANTIRISADSFTLFHLLTVVGEKYNAATNGKEKKDCKLANMDVNNAGFSIQCSKKLLGCLFKLLMLFWTILPSGSAGWVVELLPITRFSARICRDIHMHLNSSPTRKEML